MSHYFISTIFKTHTKDLDGFTNKIGFSKRTFAEWGSQVSQSFKEAEAGANRFTTFFKKTWAGTKTAFHAPQDIKNIELIGASNFDSLFGMNSEQFFQDFNKSGSESLSVLTKWCDGIGVADDTMRAYLTDCMQKQVPASFEGYNNYVKTAIEGTKKLSLGMKALSVAGNMLLSIGISMAISAIIDRFQALANAQENAIAKADEFISEFNEQRTSLTENKKAIDSMSEDYEELAKGVDSLGRNVSLNSDEYARYNEIVNQIADMFPQMVQGYTDEGNAIIAHKGNVEELTKAYEDQKKAAQDAIIVGSADVFKGFKAKVDNDAIASWEETGLIQLKSLGDYLTSIINDQEKVEEFLSNLGSSTTDFNYVQLKDLLVNAGYDVSWNDYDKALKDVKTDPQKLRSYLSKITSEMEAEAAKIKPIMQAYLEQSYDYQGLDEDVQDIVKQIVGQFDSEFYAQFDNETEMAAWVTENIVNKFKGKDGEKLASEFQMVLDLKTQFNNNEIPLAEYESKLTKFLSTISTLPDETQKAIKLIFGISEDGYDSNQANKNKILKMLKGSWEEAKEYVGSLTLDELEIGAKLEFNADSISVEDFKKKLEEAKKATDKMRDSLDSLSSAIKAAESAFELFDEVEKDFNSTGAISAKNIQKILSKFPELEDELYEYIMGMRTGASVMELLKTKSDDMVTMSIKAFKRMYLSSNLVSKDIKDDYESAFKLIGLEWDNTQSVMANVNTQIVDANGQATQTFVKQWSEACKLAGANVSTFAQGISALLGGDFYDGTSGVYRVQGKGIYYKDGSGMDGKGTNLVNVKAMELIDSGQFANTEKGRSDAYKAAYNILSNQMDKSWENQAEFERRQKEFEERMKQYAVTSDDKSGKDSDKPDYEDPTEAIINRINLRAKEFEQQEESIQNAIEIAELENDYKKQISLTNDKLDVQRQKVNALKTANDELHKMAEDLRNSTPQWNEEEWFNSQGQATEEYTSLYNNSSKEEQEKIKDQFEKISKIKEAWVANDEERLSLTKEILQTEEDIINLRKEQFDKANDFGSSYLDSRKTLLESYYDVTNSIAEAQHEINKELETSKTMYEYLDKETQQLLFNQEDYNELSDELYDIQYRADKLKRQYERDLSNSTLETIESITSNYQMQYETLMKSYEIAKADLEIAKKKQKLNNVLNERNVRMFINGSWQWVANTEDVANAKSELADAEYAKRVEEAGLTQQQSINNLTKQQDELGVVIKKFESGVIDLEEAIRQAEEAIGSMPNALASIFNNAKVRTPSSYSSGGSGGGSGGGFSGGNSGGGQNTSYINWAKSQMAENSKNWHTADANGKKALEAANQALGKAIDSTYDPTTGKWKHKYATGSKYTKDGLSLLGEEGFEAYISSNGRLIPINQPMIGDIPSGGVVFNTEQMKNLRTMWDMSNLKFNGGTFVGGAQPQQIDQSQDNRIIINGMTVDSGSADGQALISALRRYVGNH